MPPTSSTPAVLFLNAGKEIPEVLCGKSSLRISIGWLDRRDKFPTALGTSRYDQFLVASHEYFDARGSHVEAGLFLRGGC